MAEKDDKNVAQTIKSWVSGWVSSRFFERRAYRKTSNGVSSSGLPILLNSSGKLDSSFYGLVQVTDANFTLVDDVDATKKFQLQLSSIATATTRTWTVPNFSDTFVGLGGSQTLTNKTLTTPVIGNFTNATHNHLNASGGGVITAPAIVAGSDPDGAFGGSGVYSFPSGIVVAAGQDTLSHYDEGNWPSPPVLSFGGASVGITYGARTGTYTRIGRFVFVYFSITLTNKGSSVGGAAVTNLPFTVSNSTDLLARWASTTTAFVNVMGRLTAASTTINLFGLTAAATTQTQLTDTDFSNTTIIRFSGMYEI